MPDVRRPIFTLTTDFGLSDWYVAAMKAVLLNQISDATIVDITHSIRPGDVVAGSFALERAMSQFRVPVVHIAVVDPGVGTSRRILLGRHETSVVICPDNGLITWAFHRLGKIELSEITWRPAGSSNTFHGRDVMAPLAAMIASGVEVKSVSKSIDDPVLLPIAPVTDHSQRGQIIYVDHYGNATTNVPAELMARHREAQVIVNGRNLGPVKRTYADIAPGEMLALIGSAEMLEIAVRLPGSTVVKVGDRVEIKMV